MIITKEYLNKHKTNKGAYTRKQLEILGIGWPPSKKWERLVLDKEITFDEATLFEKAKNIKVDSKRKKYKKLN
jgi:hypothetical protein